jgi:chromosome segregation ATPase
MLTVPVIPVTEQVAELESTNKSLEEQLEEQSSNADNAISQWQESYTALEVRKVELEMQLETQTKEKEELLNAERSSSALAVEELRSEKGRLEQELRERDEALAAAGADHNQDADAVNEWQGELLEGCAWFSRSEDLNVVADADVSRFLSQSKSQSLSRQTKVWKISLRNNLAMPITQSPSGKRAILRWRNAVRNWKGSSRL